MRIGLGLKPLFDGAFREAVKSQAITGAIDQKAPQIGQWILDDLRALIATIASTSEDNRLLRKLLTGLRRVCHLGKKADHTKLQALAKEIRLGLGCGDSLC